MQKIIAEPEFIGRRDTAHGNWAVSECNPRRGEPMTNIIGREMLVPTHDTQLARVIRAHEMMHAKVSPAESYVRWIERKIATNKAMTVVEELRVNLLCQKAGFDVKGNLTDGGETADGERVGATKDWQGAVHMAIATAGTASNKAFLNGVRRTNREWGPILADISKRALKEMDRAYKTGTLASTEVDKSTGLAPLGFTHTERIAEWVDRLASITPQEPEEASTTTTAGDGEGEEKPKRGRGRPKKENPAGGHGNSRNGGEGSATGNPYKKITPDGYNGIKPPAWGELRIERCAMPKQTKGHIGKKRTASNIGRAPRRIHRLLTDPEKRIFDKVTRGGGGVVIIDGSGSMSFTHEQIRQIVENAPGATVAVYTENPSSPQTAPNMWIVADKGKMVTELPDVFGHGNGVDFPAIEWAVKNRQRSSSPVIWVTDGGVCPTYGNYSDQLAMQCIKYVMKNNIIIVPYVSEAVDVLRKMKNGVKPKSQWPTQFRWTYQEKMGVPLPS